MQTHEAEPMYCPDVYIKADLSIVDYPAPINEAPALLKAWEEANENTDPYMTRYFGSMFLFRAGMMYGIRKERARRKRAGM